MENGSNNLNGGEDDKVDGESNSSDKQKPGSKRSELEKDGAENTQSSCAGNRPKRSSPTPSDTPQNTLPTSHSDSHFSRTISLNEADPQNSEEKREKSLEDEATRLFLDMASDPDLMNQAINAAVNPNVAKELARQADTAWRNIETVPGGYQALCQMHQKIQQPLWNAVIGRDMATPSRNHSHIKTPVHNEPIKVNAMPNPWKTIPQHQQQQQQRSFGSFPTSLFGDFNPLTYLTGSIPDPVNPSSSPAVSSDMLSSVINRTSPTSFQTASQLIQNTNTGNYNNNHSTTCHGSVTSSNSNADDNSNKYSREIEELAQMGLTDREKCLIALEAADGDIFQALGILEELEKEESQDK